ncbi:E3 ubiquitin-protein ligase DZIP3-like [Orbicella faveolata]|uniref:E3 ubiquitin-protein ligase DZIP3-like n=1 Tax=Orbicella faveolata TaxID=48498 RepID=UPI0009E5E849|nr:E3 ubiquitin-protein ligase DZIP3-like [Orbicella faveolata]
MASSTPKRAPKKEATNYARLCRLLIDFGCQALRDTFDNIHASARLHAVLAANRSTLRTLRKQRVLNAVQWSKLYPAIATSASLANFDITLLIVLLRHICGLEPPTTTQSWDRAPPTTDMSREADIVRLKCFRNDIYGHAEKASISDLEFSTLWQNIHGTLVRLGGQSYEKEIDSLQVECMEPEIEQYYTELLKEWKKDEDNIKYMLNEVKNEAGNISRKLDDFATTNTFTRGQLVSSRYYIVHTDHQEYSFRLGNLNPREKTLNSQ